MIVVRALVLTASLAVTGCMTDMNGNTCAWAPGGDGTCPSDSGSSGSSGPTYHSYLSATAVAVGGGLRVLATGYGAPDPAQIETMVLPRADGVALQGPTPILFDGEPLQAIVPRVAAIGDQTYLSWRRREGRGVEGAPLAADGTVVTDRVIQLAGDDPNLYAVGDRFVALGALDGAVGAIWIAPDGLRTNTTVFAPRDAIVAAVGAGEAMLAVALHLDAPDGGHALAVVRTDATGDRLDRTPIVLAQTVPTESWLTGASAAVLADGTVLVIYRFQTRDDVQIRVARIAPDGRLVDERSSLPDVPQLVRSGSTLLAVSRRGEYAEETLVARVLDERGVVIAGPTDAAPSPYGRTDLVPAPDGFAIVYDDGSVHAGWLDETGAPRGAPTVVAARYEIGGCQAGGGGAGGWVALAIVAALARARRGSHRLRSRA